MILVIRAKAGELGCWPDGLKWSSPCGWCYEKTNALWLGIEQLFLKEFMNKRPAAKFGTVFNKMKGVNVGEEVDNG